ncbi:MAG: hypothetical protein RL748_2501, partial [Pseudomonadota bacterium]
IASLKTSQLAAFSAEQFAALSSSQIPAITTTQEVSLSTTQIVALTTAQIVALSTSQVPALRTSHIQALSTRQLVAMETTDIAALTMAQVDALSTAQRAALTTAQLAVLPASSPIILDLNNDGVQTINASSGVQFDIFGTGSKVATGWVSSSDGLLALDRNHDGLINDGSELFGDATRLADGSQASNGYQALQALDDNLDGQISNSDAAFAKLRVWVDGNSDGLSQANELHSLTDLGITRIASVANDAAAVKNNGNLLGLHSSYETADGQTHASADVWFTADRQGAGLTQRVGALAHAISAFEHAPNANVLPTLPLQPQTAPAALLSLPVADLVQQLRLFETQTAPQPFAASDSKTASPWQRFGNNDSAWLSGGGK